MKRVNYCEVIDKQRKIIREEKKRKGYIRGDNNIQGNRNIVMPINIYPTSPYYFNPQTNEEVQIDPLSIPDPIFPQEEIIPEPPPRETYPPPLPSRPIKESPKLETSGTKLSLFDEIRNPRKLRTFEKIEEPKFIAKPATTLLDEIINPPKLKQVKKEEKKEQEIKKEEDLFFKKIQEKKEADALKRIREAYNPTIEETSEWSDEDPVGSGRLRKISKQNVKKIRKYYY